MIYPVIFGHLSEQYSTRGAAKEISNIIMLLATLLILLPRLECIMAVACNSFQLLHCQQTLFKTLNVISGKTTSK